MPRWNPIPSALELCRDEPTDTETQPGRQLKTNGYVFREIIKGNPDEKRYVPKICRAMPLYPKTYGLSCGQQDCPHCHPGADGNLSDKGCRPVVWRRGYRGSRRSYLYQYRPPPFACVSGRMGCRPEKMIQIRPGASHGAAEDEHRRPAAEAEKAPGEAKDKGRRDRTQRLSKWGASTSRRIDEGRELASDDISSPTDGSAAAGWDVQLAILASLGLLDDYEAEDADVTPGSLRRDEDTYTVRYKSGRKSKASTRGGLAARETPIPDGLKDWELVSNSHGDDALSWVMLDEWKSIRSSAL